MCLLAGQDFLCPCACASCVTEAEFAGVTFVGGVNFSRPCSCACARCVTVAEFTTYLIYCRSLRFDDKPDYAYLRRLFRDLFFRQGYAADYRFDWTVLNYVSARARGVCGSFSCEYMKAFRAPTRGVFDRFSCECTIAFRGVSDSFPSPLHEEEPHFKRCLGGFLVRCRICE